MTRHEELFEGYVRELKQARQSAQAWWESLINTELPRVNGRDVAQACIRKRWPRGPASHPFVLTAFRQYYLACDTLNLRLKQEAAHEHKSSMDLTAEQGWGTADNPETEGQVETPVPPRVFTIDWLYDKEKDLLAFLSDVVVFPVGLDEAGRII